MLAVRGLAANSKSARCCQTCIQSAKNLTAYSFAYCDNANVNNITNLGILHDNKVYNPDGKMMVLCGNGKGIGSHGPITAKLLTEAEFQATGADPGTTVHVTPEYGPLNYRTAARTLFLRPYLAHFCPVFSRFFAVFSVLTPGFQKVAPKDRGPVP